MSRFATICSLALVLTLAVGESFAAAPLLRNLGQLRSCAEESTGIAVDNAGNLFLAKAELESIAKFDIYGRKLQHFDPLPIAKSGLAVSPLGDRIYVAGEKQVLLLNGDNGKLLTVIGKEGDFEQIAALGLDSKGHLYIADAGSGFMQVYSQEGDFKGNFPLFDIEQSRFVAMAINGLTDEIWLVVAARENPQGFDLEVFNRQGAYLRRVDLEEEFGVGEMISISSRSFDPLGRLYVLDRQANTILSFDTRSAGASQARVAGMGPAKDPAPCGMVVDPVSCRLFVYSGANVFIMQID